MSTQPHSALCLLTCLCLIAALGRVSAAAVVGTQVGSFAGSSGPNTYAQPFVTAPNGPITATHNAFGHAFSLADYGHLSASASMAGMNNPNLARRFVHGQSASWDRVTISASNLQGQGGTFTFGIRTTGTVNYVAGNGAGGNAAPDAKISYGIWITPDDGVPLNFDQPGGATFGNYYYQDQTTSISGDPGLLSPQIASYTYPFTFGLPFEIAMLTESLSWAFMQRTGHAETGITLDWNGIGTVTGPNGAVVNGFTIQSDSGFNYANPLAPSLPGDVDGDHQYACSDIDFIGEGVSNAGNLPVFDLNGDSLVDAADRSAWLATAGATNLGVGHAYLPGDANLDGVVDGSDFGIWNSRKFTSSSAWCGADFNSDASIDGSDFGVWNANKFQASDLGGLVPEPGSLAPLTSGLLALAWKARRTRLRNERMGTARDCLDIRKDSAANSKIQFADR